MPQSSKTGFSRHRRRDDEQTIRLYYESTHIQRRTVTEEQPWNGQQKKATGCRGREEVNDTCSKIYMTGFQTMVYRSLSLFLCKKRYSGMGDIIRKTCLYNINPFKTPLLYSKTGVYRGIYYFSYFCSKT